MDNDLTTFGEILRVGEQYLKRSRRSFRASMALAATAMAVALAGCNTDGTTQIPTRALKALSQDMVAEIERKGMPSSSPILVRIFKEEAELEIWKQDGVGRFALLKTYPICRWSGELGPKIKEGDRQAPEGFYQITPGLMNPHSNYYLAFNLGFPNTYDKANDRTGAFLMVHGDCSSRGCYAMTDEQIEEIFALGRDSFSGGQKSFQVQAYPFRMTALNMAKHRNSPHMAFWRMLKQGNDHFELTKQEPKVDVCEKRYVFNAESADGRDLGFSSRNRCPAYQVNPEVAAAVREKHDKDERQFADYAARNTPTVAVRTGADGGMHPTFLARLKPKNLLDGIFGETKIAGARPGTVPAHVNPPRAPGEPEFMTASASSSTPPVRAAAYVTPVSERQVRSAAAAVTRNEPRLTPVALRGPQSTPPKSDPRPEQKVADAQSAQPPAAPAALMTGAVAAPLPASSFDSRWGGGGPGFR
jgi:murein L,D-transpeptidase YafK